MSNSITYNPYSPGDEKGIVELLKNTFPKWKQLENPLQNWIWKYREAPLSSTVYVAKDGEQIVGVAHRIILEIKINDKILRSHYEDDLAIHQDYRGRGVWTSLKNLDEKMLAEKGIQIRYQATENPVVQDHIMKLGYKPFNHYISHFLKIYDQKTFQKNKQREDLVTTAGVAALRGLSEVKQLLSSKPIGNEDYSIVDVPRFDYRVDAFWEKVKKIYDYCIVKNAKYLNWKHSRPNVSEHKLRFAVKGEEILGFSDLALRVDGEYREASISELQALPSRLDVADALIGDACEEYGREGVTAIYYQVTRGHPYEELAERNGFIDASSQIKTKFYYSITNNSIPEDYLENLPPSRVQLNYF